MTHFNPRDYSDDYGRGDRGDRGSRRGGKSSGAGRPRAVPESITEAGPTTTGKIKTLNMDRGFGFIKDGSGQEYFFHRSETAGAFDTFQVGETVSFSPQASSKGPRAHQVCRVGEASSAYQGLPEDADDHHSDE